MFNLLVEINLTHNLSCFHNLLCREDCTHSRTLASDILTNDALLLFEFWVADDHLQHEAVYLCLGQWVCTFLFDRVLRSQHEEWRGQAEGLLSDGDLTLLHGFEQSTLHLGGSTVYFVGEDKVSEDRPLFDHELLVLLRIDHSSGDICRKQVWGELNAAELSVDKLRQSLDGEGLCETRDAFEEDVAVGEKADK